MMHSLWMEYQTPEEERDEWWRSPMCRYLFGAHVSGTKLKLDVEHEFLEAYNCDFGER